MLLTRARAGDAGAFAALVHRYAPVLHAAATEAGADDLDAAVTTALRRAMRRLEAAEPADLASWFVGLLPAPRRGQDIAVPDEEHVAPLPDPQVDAIWAALAPRWPTGRRPVRVPRWVGQVALVLVLVALSVALPILLLTSQEVDNGQPEPLAEVIAEPLEEDDLGDPDTPDGDEQDGADGDG
ncbi:MAG: hypothetical protein ACLFS9_04235 [Nitriliruptoraceae bacterium]